MTPAIAETSLHDHDGDCQVCTSATPPLGAYRPHTLKRDCWCTSPTRYGGKCELTLIYPGITAE